MYLFIYVILKKKNFFQDFKTKNFAYIFLIVSSDLFILLMIPMYNASYLFILPSFFILQLTLISFFNKKDINSKFKISHIILIVFMIFLLNKNIFIYPYNKHDVKFLNDLNAHVEKASDKTALALGSYTTGSIWFVKTQLNSLSRYHYTPPIDNEIYLNEIYSEYYRLIEKLKPNYILFNPYFYGGHLDKEQKIFQNTSCKKLIF